jgi:hypothetical protein
MRGKMKTYILLILLLLRLSSAAAVLLSRPMNIEGTAVYPDDRDKGVYYYVPGELNIKISGGVPEFFFHRYRYLGTRATGDSGAYKGRGVISFTVERPRVNAKVIQSIKKHLGPPRPPGRTVELRPIPIEKIQSQLVYTTIEKQETGTLAGGRWSGQETGAAGPDQPDQHAWETKRFTIGTNILTTNLLWSSYHKEGVILSLNYSLVVRGVSDLNAVPGNIEKLMEGETKETAADTGETGDADPGLEEVHQPVLNSSLVISVSPSRHPDRFKSIDVGAEMTAGYTFLDIYCYDFQDPPGETGIFRKEVEIKGFSISGARPVQKAVFSSSDPDRYMQSIQFPFAMDMTRGFAYRVKCIDTSGSVRRGEWIHRDQWSGILDVTDYKEEIDHKPKKDKRRNLY